MPPTLDRHAHATPAWRDMRQRIIERDKNICRYCGSIGHQVDYKRPPKQGGKPIPSNLVCCCAPCLRASNDAPYPTFADKTAFILAHRITPPYNGQYGERLKGLDPKIPLLDQPVSVAKSGLRAKIARNSARFAKS